MIQWIMRNLSGRDYISVVITVKSPVWGGIGIEQVLRKAASTGDRGKGRFQPSPEAGRSRSGQCADGLPPQVAWTMLLIQA